MGMPLSKKADVVALIFSNPLDVIRSPKEKLVRPIIVRRIQSFVVNTRRIPREKANSNGMNKRKALTYLMPVISDGDRSSRRILIKGGDAAQIITTKIDST